ncbi:unnamed protein product [Dovyalis caffra]|uniref:Uncharacterized protein n=1 Tax=Dovyalis caffra TaxID=77055 RepID=A0AAV1SIP3_9ROSI|nr:unnamed protein product [Dovyalis caffra]
MVAAYLLLVFPAILSPVLSLSSQDHQTQLYEANLKISQSESRLEEITQNINARDSYLEKCEDEIGELDHELNNLQSALSNLKITDEKIKALEEEVRVLWATLRKNNFDFHVLESKAREAEDRLEMVTSQVEKMEDIVSEMWIQIQQFEQALQLKEVLPRKTNLAYYEIEGSKTCKASKMDFFKDLFLCVDLQFFSNLSGEYLPNAHGLLRSHLGEESALRAYVSQTFLWLKRFYSMVKESHHEFQGVIKHEMERHEFTACLANKEIVFFVASAIIIFPVLSAWILLSSQLR